MRVSSCLVTHSAVAILATALLCGLSGTATSQARLPSVTIDAPKQMARPHRLAARPPQRPQVASTSAYRPLPPNPAPGTVMARFAEFENIAARANSSCADGLPDKFQTRQPTLGWMLLARQFCPIDNMQKRSRLQNLRGVQGGRNVRGLETS